MKGFIASNKTEGKTMPEMYGVRDSWTVLWWFEGMSWRLPCLKCTFKSSFWVTASRQGGNVSQVDTKLLRCHVYNQRVLPWDTVDLCVCHKHGALWVKTSNHSQYEYSTSMSQSPARLQSIILNSTSRKVWWQKMDSLSVLGPCYNHIHGFRAWMMVFPPNFLTLTRGHTVAINFSSGSNFAVVEFTSGICFCIKMHLFLLVGNYPWNLYCY